VSPSPRATRPPAHGHGTPLQHPERCRLVVAEDTATSRRLLQSMLRSLGGPEIIAETVFVTNGREAFDAFLASQETVELVILDMCIAHARARRSWRHDGHPRRSATTAGSRACPVLALSADAFTEQRERALAQGFSDYLTKPISLAQLAAVVAEHLGQPATSAVCACATLTSGTFLRSPSSGSDETVASKPPIEND
jgi:CheY-like chemotaxis protein